jgi:hypothetical protein
MLLSPLMSLLMKDHTESVSGEASRLDIWLLCLSYDTHGHSARGVHAQGDLSVGQAESLWPLFTHAEIPG